MPRPYKKRYVPTSGKFGKLEIKETYVGYNGKTFARCLCECGKYTAQLLTAIVHRSIVSCGCYKAKQAAIRASKLSYKHGKGNLNNRLYRIWCALRSRCRNKNHCSYEDYGGRGIKVCEEWKDYLKFEQWSLTNGYQESLSIDRINVNGDYEPSNCRWVTAKQQARNRRNNRMDTVKITAFGETKAALDWLEDNRCKMKSITSLVYRIGAGWSPEEAITKPSQRGD
jgi:hypothetical protein